MKYVGSKDLLHLIGQKRSNKIENVTKYDYYENIFVGFDEAFCEISHIDK